METTVDQLTFDFHREQAEILRGGDELNVKIGDFAGPLDLLLFLIKQKNIMALISSHLKMKRSSQPLMEL